MAYRLGIDLGTSSIGAAAYRIDDNGRPQELVFADSYIFGEPINPKDYTTLNSKRRAARLIRRQTARKAARMRKIAYISESIGITKAMLDKVPPYDIHRLRAAAVDHKISLPEFIAVLFHLVKNRGYFGEVFEDDGGKIKAKINETSNEIKQGGLKTLGQLLYHKKQQACGTGIHAKESWRKLNEGGTFITRKIIEDEFELIWQEQARHHKELSGNYKISGKFAENMFPDYPNEKEITLKKAFRSALFYQRPIKWPLASVGKCPLVPGEYRAAISQPAYQQYRLLKQLTDLRVKNRKPAMELFASASENSQPQMQEAGLTYGEIQTVLKYALENCGEYSKDGKILYSKIYELLNFEEGQKFTADRPALKGKGGIKGEMTLCLFNKFGLSHDWHILSEKEQEIVLEFLNNITKYSDLHNSTYEYIQQQIEKLAENVQNQMEIHRKNAFSFIKKIKEAGLFSKSDFRLEQGRAEYGITALGVLTHGMLEGKQEYDIIEENYPKQVIEAENLRSAEEIIDNESINDAVIKKALREFKREMDFIIRKMGEKPAEITIELSREIKNSLSRRQYLETENRNMEAERIKAAEELQKKGVIKTSGNIERYMLYEEQDHKCPYCPRPIKWSDAFSPATEVDHIIPQAKGGPNVYSNKVLVHKDCNLSKGNNTPYDAVIEYEDKKVKKRNVLKGELDIYLEYLAKKKELASKKRKKQVGEDEAIERHYHLGPVTDFIQRLLQLFLKEGYYDISNRKYKKNEKIMMALLLRTDKEKVFKLSFKGRRIRDKIDNLLTKNEDISGDFSARQNQETAWIGKVVMDWCQDICPRANIVASTGALTAYMRSLTGFEKVLPLVRIAEGKTLYHDDKCTVKINPEHWQLLFNGRIINMEQGEPLEIYDKRFPELKDSEILKQEFEEWLKEKEEHGTESAHTKKDIEQSFRDFCKDMSSKAGVNTFYKRCDHRHHAIDAAIIGLCTRSLVQRANTHAAKHGTLKTIHNPDGTEIPCFMPLTEGREMALLQQFRKKLLYYMKDYAVWHKPDHFPSGEMLQQTAYGLNESEDGKIYFVCRVDISKFDKKSENKTIKELENYVVGEEIKKEIIRQFKERIAVKMTIHDALCGKKDDPSDGIYFKGNKVKKVKAYFHYSSKAIFNKNTDREIISKDKSGGEHRKAYINGGYACAEFNKTTGKLESIIPLWDYERFSKEPISSDLERIYTGDILCRISDRTFYVVYKMGRDNGLFLRNVSETTGNDITTKNIKDFRLVPDRKTLAQLKKN